MFKSIKKRLKDQRGLTLVELLAVIVILGIIAGIAVPNIGKIVENTKADAKVSEGIQIIQAAKLYMTTTKVDFTNISATDGDDIATTVVLKTAELGDYLDNINDTNYKIVVAKDSASGKFSYTLKTHNSIAAYNAKFKPTTAKTVLTEKELLDY